MIRDTPDDDEVERDGVSGASGRGKEAESGPIVIDLTLSSSDEEETSEDERQITSGNSRWAEVNSCIYVKVWLARIQTWSFCCYGYRSRSMAVACKNVASHLFL